MVVTLYNYAGVVTETLDSIAASRASTAEIVVVDDHSSDDGVDVVRRFMDAHPDGADAAARQRRQPRAAGCSQPRRRRAPGPTKIMVMDADNLVYPNCLRRLRDALDADPAAAFAYSTLEAFGADPGLRSHLDWHAAVAVRVELHRRPGDGAAVDVPSATAAT